MTIPDFGNKVLGLGPALGYRAQIDLEYSVDHSFGLFLKPYFELRRIGQGETTIIRIAGGYAEIHEPASEATHFGAVVGARMGF